jgi:hypothetical protein
MLVADALQIPHKTNWRKHPNEQQALRDAETIRALFSSRGEEKN